MPWRQINYFSHISVCAHKETCLRIASKLNIIYRSIITLTDTNIKIYLNIITYAITNQCQAVPHRMGNPVTLANRNN